VSSLLTDVDVSRLLRARQRHRSLQGALWGLGIVLALGLSVALVGRLWPLWYQQTLLPYLGGGLLMGTLLGAAVGRWWPEPVSMRLQQLDQRLELANRLRTAWELERGEITAPMPLVQAQAVETRAALRRVDPRAAFPLYPRRAPLLIVLGLTLLFLPALLLPNSQEQPLRAREALQQATALVATELQETAQELLADASLDPETLAAALEALDAALEALEDPQATPEEQLAALNAAEHALAELRSLQAEARLQHLSEAVPLSSEAIVAPLAAALEAGDLEAAARYLEALAKPGSRPLTQEEVLALADAFREMSTALQDVEPELAQALQTLVQELYTGDLAGSQQALTEVAQSLDEIAQAAASSQALEAAQAQLQAAQQALGQSQAGQGPPPASFSPTTGGAADSGAPLGGFHSEDSGAGAPYGETAHDRTAETGGLITLPRAEALGTPQETLGQPGPAQISYREVYATYAEAAEAELSRRALPPALRAYLHSYFSGLGE